MNRVIVHPEMQAKLFNAQSALEVCSESGQVLGHFIPVVRVITPAMEPTISEEELQRREQQGGGRPLAEILRDLETRE